jgi:hypothetical protein
VFLKLLIEIFCYKNYSITETDWFTSYLDHRYQRTSFNRALSTLKEVQLADIISSLKHSQVSLFADDTLFSVADINVADCVQKMNEDLESLSKWLRFNKLKLNVTKTKYIIIRGSHLEAGAHNNLCIDDETIKEFTCIEYFGLQIDNR